LETGILTRSERRRDGHHLAANRPISTHQRLEYPEESSRGYAGLRSDLEHPLGGKTLCLRWSRSLLDDLPHHTLNVLRTIQSPIKFHRPRLSFSAIASISSSFNGFSLAL
jgi:hypothetical protein